MVSLDNLLSVAIDVLSDFKWLATLLLLLFGLAIKHSVVKIIRRRSKFKGEDRRHQINSFKNLFNAALFLLIIFIWASEVQSVAISIAAFMVAIVFATREFIQCLLGFIYYLITKPFRVGEWVEIGHDIMGEVISLDWAKVTILEVDPETYIFTGKHLYVANSLLITKTVKNLNFMRRYSMHDFSVTVEPDINCYELMPEFEYCAKVNCAHFHDVALRYRDVIERHMEAEFITIEPSVLIETNKFANVVISVSLFCPTEEAFNLQQKISSEIVTLVFKKRQEIKEKEAKTAQALSQVE
ncbi:MAG: mechanosensitive ion channel family protein [Aestuariibacter sp.]